MRGIIKENRPEIKAILFDKDGTILNFHSIWIKTTRELLQTIINVHTTIKQQENDFEEMYGLLSKAIGFAHEKIDANGILAGGTMQELSETVLKVLQENQQARALDHNSFYDWASKTMYELTKKYRNELKAITPNLSDSLRRLKERNLVLGVATADDLLPTKLCLNQLEISSYFKTVITADNFPFAKPDPSIVYHFCKEHDLIPEQVAVVGDTLVDMSLAKHSGAGLAIGVLSGVSSDAQLNDHADIVLSSVEELINVKNQLIWERME